MTLSPDWIGPDLGFPIMVGFLGFLGKAVKSAVNIAGKVVGIGGGGSQPITVQTKPDPAIGQALAGLTESNRALAAQIQGKKGMPTWAWIAIAGVVVVGGGFFLLRKRR